MKIERVVVVETLRRIVEIEVNDTQNHQDAVNMIDEQRDAGELVLTADDFYDYFIV